MDSLRIPGACLCHDPCCSLARLMMNVLPAVTIREPLAYLACSKTRAEERCIQSQPPQLCTDKAARTLPRRPPICISSELRPGGEAGFAHQVCVLPMAPRPRMSIPSGMCPAAVLASPHGPPALPFRRTSSKALEERDVQPTSRYPSPRVSSWASFFPLSLTRLPSAALVLVVLGFV
ncbi:hypothetical protein FKP32DRAFT_471830 [Trametes sanguinea]|nr:hypothetical protein FKP32DRAFT_471830 [Trametes sanguinea]